MQINRTLPTEIVENLLKLLLLNKPVSILRTISRTGKYAQSVPWVYFQCDITGSKRATFISLSALSEAFWQWLEVTQVMALALWKRIAIAKVIWHFVPVGVEVYHADLGWVDLIDKDLAHDNTPQFWISDKDDQLSKIDPALVREFLW